MAAYSYAIIGVTSTFPNKKVNTSTLTSEILASGITSALDYINTDEISNLCIINFLTTLSAPEQTILNGIIASHTGNDVIATVPTTADAPGTAVDGRIPVENGTSGASFRQSLASIDANGSVNLPAGQLFKIGGVALAKSDITGLKSSDTPSFNNVNLIGLAANSIVMTDGSKNLTASAAAKTAFNQDFETSTSNIKMDGTVAIGASSNIARADHVHPSDSSKAALVSSPVTNQILLTNVSGQPIVSGKVFNDTGNSTGDVWSASQIAAYVASQVSGLSGTMHLKGAIDASTNPNYPVGVLGDNWIISVAGKIGGASGITVDVHDTIICLVANSATGDQATVGTNWTIIQANVIGAVTSPDTTSVANNIVIEAGTTGTSVKQSLAAVDASGSINIPTGQTYKINGVALAKANITGLTDASSVTFANIIDSGLTASTVPYSNASKQLTSSAVTPTELGYLSGVTSAIQTQLGTKEPTISKLTAFNQNFETLTANIKMDGAVSIGVLSTIARADHVHPNDTSKVDKVAGSVANNLVTFNDTNGVVKDSGITSTSVSTAITNSHTHANKSNLDLVDQSLAIASSPTFAGLTNSGLTASQIVQTDGAKKLVSVAPATAYNQAFETVVSNIKMDGTAAVGALATIARADHVHPTDTTREPASTFLLGSTSQYFRGDKTWQTLNSTVVGLSAVSNDSQLKRSAGDYNSFSAITPTLADVILAEGASNSFIKGSLTFADLQSLIVPVFGQNSTYAVSEALSTTTSASYQTKLTLTTPTLEAGTYRVGLTFGWYGTSTSRFCNARLFQDATTSIWSMSSYPGGTATTVISSAAGFWQGSLAAGVHTFALQYSTSNAANTMGIQQARIEFWRIS